MDFQNYCYTPHEGFEGRNQEYGAYDLRKRYTRVLTLVLIGFAFFCLVSVAYPFVVRLIENSASEDTQKKAVNEEAEAVEIELPPLEPEPPPEKQQVVIEVPPPPQVDETKFTVIEVKEDKVEKPLVENKEVEEKETAIATETKEGDASANKPEDVVVVEKPKELEKAGTGDEDGKAYAEFEVAQNAEYEGGINAFRKQLQDKIVYPAMAKRKETEGNVTVSFVVEKDGSMTDFKVLKGIGDGCDESAISAFKQMNKKWAPAKNAQGKSVRVKKTIPIVFKLSK